MLEKLKSMLGMTPRLTAPDIRAADPIEVEPGVLEWPTDPAFVPTPIPEQGELEPQPDEEEEGL